MNWWRSERSRNGGVDPVALPEGAAGRLWLCGKHFVGPDPDLALERTGADAIVCLNEVYELSSRYPGYLDWLRAHNGTRAIWLPTPDLHAPARDDVDDLSRRLANGDGLLIHCGAGIGRAGTVAAALLMLRGMSREDALRTISAARPSAGPQTSEQADFLLGLT